MTNISKIIRLSLLNFSVCILITLFSSIGNARTIPSSQQDFLSRDEIEWIKKNNIVTVAVKTGWMPIEYKIESEPSRGISVDYLTQISALTGLKFKILEYNQVFDSTEVQLVTGVVGSTKLNNFTKTSHPHLLIPYAIYINKNAKSEYRTLTLDDLNSSKVALYKNAPLGNELQKFYPKMELTYVDIADEAFEFLKNNTIDAYIGNEWVIDYHVEFHRLAYAKKSSSTRFQSVVSMAVRNDQLILLSIINKSLEKIGPNNPQILDYWKTPVSSINSVFKVLLALLLLAFVGMVVKLLSIRKKSKLEAFENQKRIWNQANYDQQTNLPNRNFFERKIKEVILDAKQSETTFAVLFIDLDDFKYVNDISGHSVGDQLLNLASKRICNCVDDNDFAARIGGDEFVIIATKIKDILIVNGLCESILDELRRPFEINDHEYFISASIGVSFFPRDTDVYEELLSYADQAMYQAKKLGRDRYVYFTKEIQSKVNEKVSIANDLRLALTRNEFELVYQPIVDLNTLNVVKAEALIRWNHPEKGLINPDQFIAIAEESGLIHSLGKWIFKQAILDLSQLHQHFGENFNVAINISPIQFTQPQNFVDFLQEIDAKKISPSVIIFEITEGLLLAPSDVVTNTINFLKGRGVKFSIDDFGTGYSALAYLKSFDIDYLKIDKAFTRELESDLYNSSLCQFIILMAHNLKIQVIAEGVEHQIQESVLRNLGCDFVQGYLHGKPMSIQKIIKL